MAFIVKGTESTFTPAPAGTHNAVCVDVVDLGEQETAFGRKHRCRFVWEIDELRPEHGDRFLVFATMNVSLHESSTMGALLRSWRGRDFTPDELKGFDVDNVIGAPCMITVVHNVGTNGNTYANVDATVPLPKGMGKLAPSGGYTRQKDRPDGTQDARSAGYTPSAGEPSPVPVPEAAAAAPWAAGDDLPF